MRSLIRRLRRLALGSLTLVGAMLCMALTGCANLQAPAADHVNRYLLDAQPELKTTSFRSDVVLAISATRAAPGFDSPAIAYVMRPHEIDYFTKSRWIDAPARMLAPLAARALEHCGAFRAVVYHPGAVAADLRLDTELVRLQQEFIGKPSQVRFTVRARLVDLNQRHVIALREFEEIEPAKEDNAYGGVEAANRALQRILARLVEFSVDALR